MTDLIAHLASLRFNLFEVFAYGVIAESLWNRKFLAAAVAFGLTYLVLAIFGGMPA